MIFNKVDEPLAPITPASQLDQSAATATVAEPVSMSVTASVLTVTHALDGNSPTLIELSTGADDGLRVTDNLLVYTVGRNAQRQLLGTMKILSSSSDRASGTLEPDTAVSQIRRGDLLTLERQ